MVYYTYEKTSQGFDILKHHSIDDDNPVVVFDVATGTNAQLAVNELNELTRDVAHLRNKAETWQETERQTGDIGEEVATTLATENEALQSELAVAKETIAYLLQHVALHVEILPNDKGSYDVWQGEVYLATDLSLEDAMALARETNDKREKSRVAELELENKILRAQKDEIEEIAQDYANGTIEAITLDGSDYENVTAPDADTEPVEVVQPLDNPTATSFAEAWQQVITGDTHDISTLWDDDDDVIQCFVCKEFIPEAVLASSPIDKPVCIFCASTTTESEHDA